MGDFSRKRGGKENGPASVYAQPHTGSSPNVELGNGYGKTKKGDQLDELCVSVNAINSKPCAEPKTTGIKMRGVGAATKGIMCRGPMA
jgi:hypothetical protein